MNVKKLFIMTFILLVIYILIQISFKGLNHGHDIEYELSTDKKKFEIREIFTQNYDDEEDNYYFEISYNDVTFNIHTNYDFKKHNYVISDVYYFENDSYKCIYPVFKTDDIITDVLCKLGNDIENYTNIKGMYADIDEFVLSIVEYDSSKFLSNEENIISEDSINYYKGNSNNELIALENYKGIYIINDVIDNIKLFSKDIYTKNISGFIDNYYAVANYNNDYDFNEVFVINLDSGKKSVLTRDKSISFDSIYQGAVDNKLYFIDKTNKVQYEVSNKRISKYGDVDSNIKVYKNNSWNEINFYDATNSEYIMSDYEIDNTFNNIKYAKVDKLGNKMSGYYYLYEKVDSVYRVYKVSVQNINIRKYLFTTTNINNIVYLNDSVYYINKDSIYRYSDNDGNKIVLRSSELEFNNNIKFTIK